MTAQELKLDYFNIYDVANQRAGYTVGLQGQFDKQPEQAKLTYLSFFANPTSKPPDRTTKCFSATRI